MAHICRHGRNYRDCADEHTFTRVLRTPHRDRVIVRMVLQNRPVTGRWSVGHEPIDRPVLCVSLYGEVIPYRCRNAVAFGQIVDCVPDNQLRDLWRRWHMNDARAHCEHQNRHIAWDVVAPCSETGYRAGSRWLVEELPLDVVDTLIDVMSR